MSTQQESVAMGVALTSRALRPRRVPFAHARRLVRATILGGALLLAFVIHAEAALLDAADSVLHAEDCTPFFVTTGIVRVPQLRTSDAKDAGTLDLAVVRVRSGDRPARIAHILLAGGPGDSGVNLVLGLMKKGGTTWQRVAEGDLIGIDQRGTGKSTPNLSSSVRYGLPLEAEGSIANWVP